MAKKALDAYRDLRRELDKTESPSFSIRAFNYFINSAIDEYVAKNYADYPVLQKSLDDIRSLVKSESLTFLSNQVTLPLDYRHLLDLKVMAKFAVNVGKYKINDIIELHPERERSGMEGFNQSNAFHRQSFKTPYYNIIGNTLKLKMGSQVTVDSSSIEYVKVPPVIYLNPDNNSDYNNESNNSTLDYPMHVYFEIIKETKRIFLENIESPRYQSTLQEQSLRPS